MPERSERTFPVKWFIAGGNAALALHAVSVSMAYKRVEAAFTTSGLAPAR
jgi:hypothetical protein